MAYLFYFFFQAEDGIRDYKVTGVQTCALPICVLADSYVQLSVWSKMDGAAIVVSRAGEIVELEYTQFTAEIGRASCRERVEYSGCVIILRNKNIQLLYI